MVECKHKGVYTRWSVYTVIHIHRGIYIRRGYIHGRIHTEGYICKETYTVVHIVAPPTQGTWRSNDYVNAVRLVNG